MSSHTPSGAQTAALDPESVELSRDAFQRLTLRLGEQHWDEVKAVAAFPLSAPESCVFLIDSERNEIGFIAEVADMPPAARDTLRDALAIEYLCTRVLGITSIQSRHGVSTWDLRTARGDRTVHIKDRSDIRRLPGNRIVITDVDGMRFEIPDRNALDERSRALLDAES